MPGRRRCCLGTIRLFRALPIKFKTGDLNAKATEVGIEELHVAHEGLTFL